MQCWGENGAGQLGNGGTVPSLSPVTVAGLTGVTRIALGARHACAVVGGGVRCWGQDEALQTGSPTSQRCGAAACQPGPIAVAGPQGVSELAAGAAHTCARTDDGRLWCRGGNSFGQLGNGSASVAAIATPGLVTLGGAPLDGVQALAAGASHTCALRGDGTVYCWGRGDRGQLGGPPPSMTPEGCAAPCSVTAVYVAGLPGAPPPRAAPVDGGVGLGDGGTPAGPDAGPPPPSGDAGV